MWENTTPSTELPRDVCPGIGLLQLGVVLLFTIYLNTYIQPHSYTLKHTHTHTLHTHTRTHTHTDTHTYRHTYAYVQDYTYAVHSHTRAMERVACYTDRQI